MTADSASDAAGAQSAAARESSQVQLMMAQQMREDLSPWVESGRGANSLLNRYLGIGGASPTGTTSNGLQNGLTRDQVRQQLLSQYTRQTAPAASSAYGVMGADGRSSQPSAAQLAQMDPITRSQWEAAGQNGETPLGFGATSPGYGPGYWNPTGQVNSAGQQSEWVSGNGANGPGSEIDEDGLNAAIAKYYEEQDAQNAAAQADPTYGSLLRAYRGGEEFDAGPAFDRGPAYDAGPDFSFTGKDLASEPGYQFGLSQGEQGINRGQASRGNFLSGAALKELDRFNQDYAGTKYNEGFNRASSTYQTNQAANLNEYNVNQSGRLNEYNTNLGARQNEWNTNLGAYNDNKNRIFNFLNGVSGLGQSSAARVGANNQQVANNVGDNLLASGAAQSAGIVASGNAVTSAINRTANAISGQNGINSAGGWNALLANSNFGRSGNNYNGASADPYAANYVSSQDTFYPG